MKAPRIKTIYIDKIPPSERPHVRHSKGAFKIMYPHFDQDTISLDESSFIMLMNRNGRVIGIEQLSHDGAAVANMCRIKILRIALSTAAHSFIISHNHPSGDLNPSEGDKANFPSSKSRRTSVDGSHYS